MTLGQNLQAARKAKGLSQETLAEQIGVSRQALGKWEKDTALPGLDNLQAAAQVLGVSVDTLLGTEAAGPAPAVTLDAMRDLLAARDAEQRKHRRLSAPLGAAAPVAVVLLLVWGSVYMNWRYSDSVKDNKVLGQSELVNANEETAGDPAPAEDDYFATARLSRKQARDNAIHMLQEAESDENAEESVLNEASRTLQVLASYTVAESQIESLVTAKGYQDCVAFLGEDGVSVVVATDTGELTAEDVAKITDIAMSETGLPAGSVKIMAAN